MKTLLLGFVLIAQIRQISGYFCMEGTLSGDKCYKRFEDRDSRLSFDDANDFCGYNYRGHLATFTNKEQFDKLLEMTSDNYADWIGLKGSTFVDGSPLTYVPPNTVGSGDCGEISRRGYAKNSCTRKNNFICEQPAFAAPFGPPCRSDAVPTRDVCYKAYSTVLSFEDANKYCSVHFDGTLATFHNSEEFYTLKNVAGRDRMHWIGLKKKNGAWEFVDGSSFDFDPNDNMFGNSQPCAAINGDHLTDVPCEVSGYFVCGAPATNY